MAKDDKRERDEVFRCLIWHEQHIAAALDKLGSVETKTIDGVVMVPLNYVADMVGVAVIAERHKLGGYA